jgi:nucleoside-diphosphate-sugar epimerase
MILVTGAAGFIGHHLVKTLRDAGQPVLALVEPGQRVEHPPGPDLTVVQVDIRDRAAVLALPPVQGTIHLAAIARLQYNKGDEEYDAVNVQGTQHLVDHATACQARRFVFVSTIEAVGPADGQRPLVETDPPAPTNVYGRSKLQAEQLVIAASDRGQVPGTVLRLPMVYGPGNTLIFSRLFKLAATGFYPRIGQADAWMEFCNVHNAIHAMRLALEKPEAVGQVFFINDGRSYKISEVLTAAAKAAGRKKLRFLVLPERLALLGGRGVELAAKLYPHPPLITPLTKKPVFSRGTVAWTTKSVNWCSSEKAQRLLGYRQQVPLEQGVAEAVAWYREQGLLKG